MGRSVNISTEIPPPLSMIERLDLSRARQEFLEAAMRKSFARIANKVVAAASTVEHTGLRNTGRFNR